MNELFQQFGLFAIFDVLIIAVLVYYLLILIRGTRAAQMVTGILIIFVAFFLITQLYPLTTLKWLMNKFYSSIIIILVIIFQEDIRRVLSRMGKKSLIPTNENLSSTQIIDEITRAATSLASKRIGALIVLERHIILNRYVDVGILLDAKVSKEILLAIFHPTSPIHDGAVIVQQGRISAAGCFLPLTREEDIDPNMGTRHRAAIGISQETDAVVVLVSEEGASISLVVDGHVSRGVDGKELRKVLRNMLSQNSTKPVSDDEAASTTVAPEKMGGNWAIIEKMRLFRSRKR